jgi:hypothetical protein
VAKVKTTIEEFAEVDEANALQRMRQDNHERFEFDQNIENTIA